MTYVRVTERTTRAASPTRWRKPSPEGAEEERQLKLGHVVSATAIRKLLRRKGIGPAPLRSRQTWKAFLQAQASAIVLTDFLSVDTVLLKRLYVLLYMELATRRVIWFAVTDRPDAQWVTQQARNVRWELNQLGVPARFLIHDHDHKYGGGSDRVFEADGMAVIKTPIGAPRANSHIERQIGSTRRECIDWLLILNRRHLERVLTVWFEHYNQARRHRGLDLQTPIARSDPVLMSGPVTCDERLGGLLREYSRAPLPVARESDAHPIACQAPLDCRDRPPSGHLFGLATSGTAS
jgi:putative transposase